MCGLAACSLLQKPKIGHFNFFLIGIGVSDTARSKMHKLCAPRHAHYVDCGTNYGVIRKVIRKVKADRPCLYEPQI